MRPSHGHLIVASLLVLVQLMQQITGQEEEERPTKVGAGLLLCAAGKVLLLKRNSKHNDNTWTVPGGNVDDTDSSLLGTATREAMEELGSVPPFEVKAQITTKRGKRKQKHYTVFVADVHPSLVTQFEPQLSAESRAWKWVPWADVLAAAAGRSNQPDFDLHPVVVVLASEHANEVRSSTQACPAP